MGSFGYQVIDADGHGGEYANWREQDAGGMATGLAGVPRARQQALRQAGAARRRHRRARATSSTSAPRHDRSRPSASKDMDLEGIDVTMKFPGGAGEEWALLDPRLRRRALPHAEQRQGGVLSPCPEPHQGDRQAADDRSAGGRRRAAPRRHRARARRHGDAAARSATRTSSDPSFDVIWAEAERLGATVCVHGGGQAPDQVPIGVDRFSTRLEVHALTHPIGNMLALMSLIIGGVIHRFPKLRVGFIESGCGWLPFWLERLDEHWELMPEQAPAHRSQAERVLPRGQLLHQLRARRARCCRTSSSCSATRRSSTPPTTATGTAIPRHREDHRRAQRHQRGDARSASSATTRRCCIRWSEA